MSTMLILVPPIRFPTILILRLDSDCLLFNRIIMLPELEDIRYKTQQQHATTQQEQNVQTYGSLYYNMISNTATGGEFGQMAVTDFRRRPLGSLNNTTSPEAARVDLNRNIYGAFRAPSPADHANTSRSDNGQTL